MGEQSGKRRGGGVWGFGKCVLKLGPWAKGAKKKTRPATGPKKKKAYPPLRESSPSPSAQAKTSTRKKHKIFLSTTHRPTHQKQEATERKDRPDPLVWIKKASRGARSRGVGFVVVGGKGALPRERSGRNGGGDGSEEPRHQKKVGYLKKP